jgi:hypothetical protein
MIASSTSPQSDAASREWSLVRGIHGAIKVHDRLFHALISALSWPSLQDIAALKTANDALRSLLTLEPGPSTPVLDPLRVRLEMLKVHIAAIFIARCQIERNGFSPAFNLEFLRRSFELALAPEEKISAVE